jgi:hypothetical protein
VAIVVSMVFASLAAAQSITPTPTPTPAPASPPAPVLSGEQGGFIALVAGLGIACVLTGAGAVPLLAVLVLQMGGISWGAVWVGYFVWLISAFRKYIK